MRHAVTALALASLATIPWQLAGAQSNNAADLSYTFFEVDYANVDVDDVDDGDLVDDFDDGSGWAARGSFAFTPMFFGFADYSVTDSDASVIDENEVLLSSSQDVNKLSLGLGFNFPVAAPMVGDSDVVVRAAYTDVDYDSFDFGASNDSDLDDLNDDSSDGYFLDAALRSQLSEWADASLGVRYTDIQDADQFSVIANLLVELNQNWGLNLEVDAGDDIGYYLVGARYSFNRF